MESKGKTPKNHHPSKSEDPTKAKPLVRMPHFVANLPVRNPGRIISGQSEEDDLKLESSSETITLLSPRKLIRTSNFSLGNNEDNNDGQSEPDEQFLIQATIARIRQRKGNRADQKYKTSGNLWDAVNESKEKLWQQMRASEGDLRIIHKDIKEQMELEQRKDSNPNNALINFGIKNLKKEEEEEEIKNEEIDRYQEEEEKIQQIIPEIRVQNVCIIDDNNGRYRKRKKDVRRMFSVPASKEDSGAHGFMEYLNANEDCPSKELISSLEKQESNSFNLSTFLNKKASSSLNVLVSSTNKNQKKKRRSIKHSTQDRKSLKNLIGKQGSEIKYKFFELCYGLRESSRLIYEIHKSMKDTQLLPVKEALQDFTKNIHPMIPLVDTLIKEISPSLIKTTLWEENNDLVGYCNWNDSEFIGNIFMMGNIFINTEFTIIERIYSLFDRKKADKTTKEYVFSVIDSEGDINALENMREFPLHEKVTKVFSSSDTTVLITESGGFYVIGGDLYAGCCVGEFRKISMWTGSYYIPSFQNHDIHKIACGTGYFIALSVAGDVFSWGANCVLVNDDDLIISYQLGHSSKSFVEKPHQIDIRGYTYDVACGHAHSVLLTTLGVYTFGYNASKQLGRDTESQLGIIPSSESWNAVQVTCGKNFTLLLTSKNKLIGWGANEYGQITGDVSSNYIIEQPIIMDNDLDICYLSAGFTHCIACTRSGELYAWGSNLLGELGISTNTKEKNKKIQLLLSSTGNSIENIFFTSVNCYGYSSTAITSSGEVYCWGLLKSKNFTHNQEKPRKLDSNIANQNFICNISCGISHLFLLSDNIGTEVLFMFKNACRYEGWYRISQMRLSLLSLSDPFLLIKSIQDRAIKSIINSNDDSISLRPFITVDNAYHQFNLAHDSDTLYHSIEIKNLSSKKIKVSTVFEPNSLNSNCYTINIIPNSFDLSKNSTITITIVLKSLILPPSTEASALFHFLVQPFESTTDIQQLSRYFIMIDIIPPYEEIINNNKNIHHPNNEKYNIISPDIAEIVHNQYVSAKQSINVLQKFIPNSILNIFSSSLSGSSEPPQKQYCETFKAAVIFLDVSGFTQLTSQMALLGDIGPEMISTHLNSYFGALIDTASKFGGELVKSAGDAIMCIFRSQSNENSNEIDYFDLAIRAVQCGLEIQSSHSIYDSNQGFTLTLHIGIGLGDLNLMIVGGINNQWMHLVAGEPINQLSTCVEISNSGEVVISKQCYVSIKEKIKVEKRTENDYLVLSFIDDYKPNINPLLEINVPIKAETALRCFIHPAILPQLDDNNENQQIIQVDELRKLTSIFVKIVTDSFNINDSDSNSYCYLLQEVFSCLQSCIIQYEGLVCQFLQDDKGIIFFAAFGVPPYSHVDDPLRAIRAAIDIYNNLLSIGVHCAIGVYTGFVFTGVVGSKKRHDYTVLGDAVNMAARLMGKAHQLNLGILCGKNTFEACNLRIEFEKLEPIQVKGKDETIQIYKPKLTKDSIEKKIIVKPTAFNIIGRKDEIILLTNKILELRNYYTPGISSFMQYKQDQLTKTIILEGSPGIGKSFLAKYLLRIAKKLKILYSIGDSKAINQITPYYTWRNVLLTLYKIQDKKPVKSPYISKNQRNSSKKDIIENDYLTLDDFLNELKSTMDPRYLPYLPLLYYIIPKFSEKFSDEEIKFVNSLASDERHYYINEIIKFSIERKSCQIPILIVLEDLQWMDEPSFRTFNTIASTTHCILIIITTRDVTDNQRKQLNMLSRDRTTHLVLNPLDDSDCTDIILKHVSFLFFSYLLLMYTKYKFYQFNHKYVKFYIILH